MNIRIWLILELFSHDMLGICVKNRYASVLKNHKHIEYCICLLAKHSPYIHRTFECHQGNGWDYFLGDVEVYMMLCTLISLVRLLWFSFASHK